MSLEDRAGHTIRLDREWLAQYLGSNPISSHSLLNQGAAQSWGLQHADCAAAPPIPPRPPNKSRRRA